MREAKNYVLTFVRLHTKHQCCISCLHSKHEKAMRPLVRHEKAFNLIGIALFPIKTSTTVHKIRSKIFEGSSRRTPGVLCVLKMHHAFF